MAANNGSTLTAERARELFSYDQMTGKLYWRVGRRGARVGAEAGTTVYSHGIAYRLIYADYKQYRAHRVAWLIAQGEWPKGEIDHIDGDGLNNRLVNLRDVTRHVNQRNRRTSKVNTSGVLGVHWFRSAQKWHAQIWVNGKNKSLGFFDDLKEAAAARKAAEAEYGFHKNHGRKAA